MLPIKLSKATFANNDFDQISMNGQQVDTDFFFIKYDFGTIKSNAKFIHSQA